MAQDPSRQADGVPWALRANPGWTVLKIHGRAPRAAALRGYPPPRVEPSERPTMRPIKYVQVRHDDGRWYEAELLDQHRA
jgi:hypothetical protein